jgi:hypothetical protein
MVFIPYAVWGRRYEPARRSIDLVSRDHLLVAAAGEEAAPVAVTLPVS